MFIDWLSSNISAMADISGTLFDEKGINGLSFVLLIAIFMLSDGFCGDRA